MFSRFRHFVELCYSVRSLPIYHVYICKKLSMMGFVWIRSRLYKRHQSSTKVAPSIKQEMYHAHIHLWSWCGTLPNKSHNTLCKSIQLRRGLKIRQNLVLLLQKWKRVEEGNSHLDVRKIAEEEGRDNEVGSILVLWHSIWVEHLATWYLFGGRNVQKW